MCVNFSGLATLTSKVILDLSFQNLSLRETKALQRAKTAMKALMVSALQSARLVPLSSASTAWLTVPINSKVLEIKAHA
jgi:hypothetical protein